MTTPHHLDIAGRRYTLREAAKVYSLQYATVADRYSKGDRGEWAVRPLDKGGKAKAGKNTDVAQMNVERDLKRDRQRIAHEAKRVKMDARALKLRQIREQHAALLSSPLIAASLLSSQERKEIRESIVGRQRWYPHGGAQR